MKSQDLFKGLGAQIHECDRQLRSLHIDSDERIFYQVLRNCYEEAFMRLDRLLNRGLDLGEHAHIVPESQGLTLLRTQMRNICNEATKMECDIITMADDGISFQAIGTRSKDNVSRQLYTSETLQYS